MFDGSKPTLLPGPNCGVYAKCIAGRACPMQCPAGLHFNAAKQICDWPFQACCDPSVQCRPDPCPPGAFGCGQNNQNNHLNNNWISQQEELGTPPPILEIISSNYNNNNNYYY
uniref:Chitin-binding type-2 domain-containing protein n=1 Tax=Anopheles melas TaxID=34690 RepID=A0A182UJ55_9DIPT